MQGLAYETAEAGGYEVEPIPLSSPLLILELHATGTAEGAEEKAMFFPIIMYGCESWTIKKAEH